MNAQGDISALIGVLSMSPVTKTTKYYDIILASFVGFLLISNICAVKIIDLNGFLTDGGALLFPLTYIFGDILTEVYGYKYARRAIWTAFGVMAIASLTFLAVGAAPAGADWGLQDSWNNILGFVPRIVIASLIAFLIGQFMNAFVLAKLKAKYGKNRMWMRLIGSTIVGELFDTAVFTLVAFTASGFMSGADMFKFIIQGWIFKTVVEIVMLPVTYRVIAFLKRAEHQDALDTKTNFNPLAVNS
jgi:queuosine precursor transporter